LNGNGFGAAAPNALTDNAALVLRAAGVQAVQLAYPALTTPDVFAGMEREIASLSQGQPIGIMGFSAGGSLAARLAGDPALHVTDVLDYYGPPDLRDYVEYHQGDRFDHYVLGHIDGNSAVIDQLSGPSDTQAHVVAAFGDSDENVVADPSAASFLKDYPQGQVYFYPGPHGVSIFASDAALLNFLTHL
jgi:dienelactone hydrolase